MYELAYTCLMMLSFVVVIVVAVGAVAVVIYINKLAEMPVLRTGLKIGPC
jgi:hypothetical protein